MYVNFIVITVVKAFIVKQNICPIMLNERKFYRQQILLAFLFIFSLYKAYKTCYNQFNAFNTKCNYNVIYFRFCDKPSMFKERYLHRNRCAW